MTFIIELENDGYTVITHNIKSESIVVPYLVRFYVFSQLTALSQVLNAVVFNHSETFLTSHKSPSKKLTKHFFPCGLIFL